MSNKEYSAEDLALDKQFQQWVLRPDPALDALWQEKIKKLKIDNAEIGKAKELVKTAGLSLDEDANMAYLQVWGNLKKEAEADKKASRNRVKYVYASVAAVLLILIIGLVYFMAPDSGQLIEYRTAYGQMQEVLLGDGSKVVLNANATLSIKSDWKKEQKREVYLTGEAFFDVAKTAELKPFIVHAADAVEIEVLGTEFNVNAIRDQVEVYLHSGRVKVHTPRGDAEMKSGEIVKYDHLARTNIAHYAVKSGEAELEWMNNMFSYDDVELHQVIQELQDYYGFDIVLADTTLNARRFTGRISRNDSGIILRVLSETLRLEFEQRGNQIIVRSAE